ncbi:MAG TPA: hypothetical protein VHB21_10770, partial [Minicystis sp.]|nr:hypothetical protein [Minicystis sp.]
MSAKWISSLVAVFALAPAALLAASCGGSNGLGDGACSLQGETCPLGCDATLGCVNCQSNSDCHPGAAVCVLGDCHECGTNADCGAGQACYPRDHKCHPSCASGGHCDPGEPICDDSGACVGCQANTDCPPDRPICSSDTGQCAECASNADCSVSNPACDLADGHCHECN